MIRGSKKLLATVFVCAIAFSAVAQGYHFIYIQADGQQPFYLKYKGKNYSSSSIGYLILPKLSDGDVAVQIGFPKNLYPEQTFNLSLAGKDYGYALKNFSGKGWGLFNFQTTDVVMNANAVTTEQPAASETVTTNKSNPFGNMLASAIDDSTLNQQHVATEKAAEKAMAPATPAQSYNTQAAVDSLEKVYSGSNSSSSKTTINSAVGSITKSGQKATGTGTEITFLDNAGKDTIHAFIPSADSGTVQSKAAANAAKNNVDNPFFNGSKSNSTATSQPVFADTATSTATSATVITNSNCQKMLSSYDIDKLKKKIAKASNQDETMAAIKKALRDKCMTTDQAKDFGNLFTSDESRYNFYDAVYPFVSDAFNFGQLQSTLIDSYYKNRFKALLR